MNRSVSFLTLAALLLTVASAAAAQASGGDEFNFSRRMGQIAGACFVAVVLVKFAGGGKKKE